MGEIMVDLNLAPDEIELMELFVAGCPLEEIAVTLRRSKRTVERMIQNLATRFAGFDEALRKQREHGGGSTGSVVRTARLVAIYKEWKLGRTDRAITTTTAPEPRPDRPARPVAVSRIDSPKNPSEVNRYFDVRGTLEPLPATSHAYLAVELGNSLWFKEPAIPVAKRDWAMLIEEPGVPPRGSFNLCLVRVEPDGQELILDWLETGRRIARYPGLPHIPDFILLDRVHLIRSTLSS
jgi:hypothetical protein